VTTASQSKPDIVGLEHCVYWLHLKPTHRRIQLGIVLVQCMLNAVYAESVYDECSVC
jgi:hypothetical protein